MSINQQTDDDNARSWPFTLRVTRQERHLLRQAALEQRTSVAEIVRSGGLDSLVSRLSRAHS